MNKTLNTITLLIIIVLMLSGMAHSAASVAVDDSIKNKGHVRITEYEWTSHTDGTVAGCTNCTFEVKGYILNVETIPDDTDVPTTLYDLEILDEDNFDILAGDGADRSATVKEEVAPTYDSGVSRHVYGDLDISITNAGSGKKGILRIIEYLEN